jgi:hypothetical protein
LTTAKTAKTSEPAFPNPDERDKTLNVLQRINAVMSEVGYVRKDATISMGKSGSYKATTHDAVLAVLRPSAVKHGLIWHVLRQTYTTLPDKETKFGSTITRVRAHLIVRICNIDSHDDYIDCEQFADGEDQGDKAPGKATSMALKYVLLKTFGLETGENEESRVESKNNDETAQATYNMVRLAFENAKTLDEIQTMRDRFRPDVVALGKNKQRELLNIYNTCAEGIRKPRQQEDQA